MKKAILGSILSLLVLTTTAQIVPVDSTSFDFWLGKWDVSWENADGSLGSGTNHIFNRLDGKIIEENFSITEGKQKGFLGMSISVFDPVKEEWHQAWADNQGGYFDFIGDIDGDKKIFKTNPLVQKDNVIIQRMVFYNIKNDSFTWDWESTKDGGRTWQLNWRIEYTRQ